VQPPERIGDSSFSDLVSTYDKSVPEGEIELRKLRQIADKPCIAGTALLECQKTESRGARDSTPRADEPDTDAR
jgi:hypothetical protein